MKRLSDPIRDAALQWYRLWRRKADLKFEREGLDCEEAVAPDPDIGYYGSPACVYLKADAARTGEPFDDDKMCEFCQRRDALFREEMALKPVVRNALRRLQRRCRSALRVTEFGPLEEEVDGG